MKTCLREKQRRAAAREEKENRSDDEVSSPDGSAAKQGHVVTPVTSSGWRSKPRKRKPPSSATKVAREIKEYEEIFSHNEPFVPPDRPAETVIRQDLYRQHDHPTTTKKRPKKKNLKKFRKNFVVHSEDGHSMGRDAMALVTATVPEEMQTARLERETREAQEAANLDALFESDNDDDYVAHLTTKKTTIDDDDDLSEAPTRTKKGTKAWGKKGRHR